MSSYADATSRLHENEPFLALVCSASKKQGVLLRSANKDQIQTLCEIAENILDKRVPLSSNEIEQLRQIKKTVYMLADKSIPWTRKRSHLANQHRQQTGGFPPLVALLAPIVGSAL